MRVAADRVRKGQLKMRALVQEIRRFSQACRTVRGTLSPGPAVDIDHIDEVINAVDNALVAIRILDLEVFEKSDPLAYTARRSSDPQGGVVRGLTEPRNIAVHDVRLIDPDLDRIVGPIDGEYIIFPKWKHRAELPSEMFEYPTRSKKGRLNSEYVLSYDNFAAGRRVLDTLLDAFSFFDNCDPAIADRDEEGKLRGFLLPPLPIGEYHRLGPDWPDHAVVEHRIRTSATTKQPHGTHREIIGWIQNETGPVYCGFTVTVNASGRIAFTEAAEQVERDVIDLGYGYYVVQDDVITAVVHEGGRQLLVGRTPLPEGVPELRGSRVQPWRGWWDLCSADANYYRSQRVGGA